MLDYKKKIVFIFFPNIFACFLSIFPDFIIFCVDEKTSWDIIYDNDSSHESANEEDCSLKKSRNNWNPCHLAMFIESIYDVIISDGRHLYLGWRLTLFSLFSLFFAWVSRVIRLILLNCDRSCIRDPTVAWSAFNFFKLCYLLLSTFLVIRVTSYCRYMQKNTWETASKY